MRVDPHAEAKPDSGLERDGPRHPRHVLLVDDGLRRSGLADGRAQALTGRVARDGSSMELAYRAYGNRYVHAQRVGDRWVDAGGVVYQDFLLWHHEDGPVVLDRAALDRGGPAFELSSVAEWAGAP